MGRRAGGTLRRGPAPGEALRCRGGGEWSGRGRRGRQRGGRFGRDRRNVHRDRRLGWPGIADGEGVGSSGRRSIGTVVSIGEGIPRGPGLGGRVSLVAGGVRVRRACVVLRRVCRGVGGVYVGCCTRDGFGGYSRYCPRGWRDPRCIDSRWRCRGGM